LSTASVSLPLRPFPSSDSTETPLYAQGAKSGQLFAMIRSAKNYRATGSRFPLASWPLRVGARRANANHSYTGFFSTPKVRCPRVQKVTSTREFMCPNVDGHGRRRGLTFFDNLASVPACGSVDVRHPPVGRPKTSWPSSMTAHPPAKAPLKVDAFLAFSESRPKLTTRRADVLPTVQTALGASPVVGLSMAQHPSRLRPPEVLDLVQ